MSRHITYLVRAESEPGLGAETLRGNEKGRWFVARTNRSAAFSFGRYVGVVLTDSRLPAAPIQSIENEGLAYPQEAPPVRRQWPAQHPVLAIITGHMAKNEIRQSDGLLGGDGLATAGLVLGYANLALGLCGCLVVLLFPALLAGMWAFGDQLFNAIP